MTQFETILNSMITNIELWGKCSIEDGSDMMIKLMTVANELVLLNQKLEFYEKQLFPDTANGEYLKKHGKLKGITKKTATTSTGTVTFKTKTAVASPIQIPAGTIIACSKIPNITFITTINATIATGTSLMQVPIESVEQGSDTAVSSQLIDILVTPISGISEVSNPTKLVGGSDGESDESYRQRVIEGYRKISNGCNLNYYEQLAKSIDGIWYAKAIYKTSPTNQIDIFVDNYTRTITPAKIAEVQQKINTAREVGISVIVKTPTRQAINTEIGFVVENQANEPIYISDINKETNAYIAELAVGEPFSTAKLSARLLQISGITDLEFYEPTSQVIIPASSIASLGSKSISFL